MKIGVCIKQVPATDEEIKIASAAAGPSLDTVAKWELNPYDEFAVEEALKLKDAGLATEVVVFTVGSAATEARLRDNLAKGADRAVRLDDPAFGGSDCLGIARILAAALKAEGVGLVLCGKQAVDGDNAQVPAMVAELLGWPQVTVVDKLEVTGEGFKAWRAAGGGAREVVAGNLPVVVTADKGLNEPRYASLKGIMMAKKKSVDVRDAAALGIDVSTVGAAAALVVEGNWAGPPARPAGRILQGDNPAVVAELVRLLREEVKVL